MLLKRVKSVQASACSVQPLPPLLCDLLVYWVPGSDPHQPDTATVRTMFCPPEAEAEARWASGASYWLHNLERAILPEPPFPPRSNADHATWHGLWSFSRDAGLRTAWWEAPSRPRLPGQRQRRLSGSLPLHRRLSQLLALASAPALWASQLGRVTCVVSAFLLPASESTCAG